MEELVPGLRGVTRKARLTWSNTEAGLTLSHDRLDPGLDKGRTD